MSLARLVSVALALAACGSKPPPPAPPRPLDPPAVAARLHGDLQRLADIARRQRGRCDPLVAELRPHVAIMRAHADDAATRAGRDPQFAAELKRELAAYDDPSRGLSESIGADLAASYLACDQRAELKQLIDQLPEL